MSESTRDADVPDMGDEPSKDEPSEDEPSRDEPSEDEIGRASCRERV